MYSKILIPLDGSKLSEAVLPYTRVLAHNLRIPVELLYVNDANQPAVCAPFLASEYLKSIAESFGCCGAVRHVIAQGDAAATIIKAAAAEPQMLIAIATHGYSGTQRWLLGSVAEKVLRAAGNHVLLVRPANCESGTEAKLTTVIVPLDGSELAEKVLPTVSQLALSLNLQVVLIRVTRRVYSAPPEGFLPVFGANVLDLKKLWQEAKAAAQQYLTEQANRLRQQGLTQVTSLVFECGTDGAAAAIIDLVKKTPDNFVAMCTHGESGITKWLLGSVTERVVHHASAPVLVIRPR
jgi:nucleotide-binding universal stress UspA family protein